jgi:hypothetical protein
MDWHPTKLAPAVIAATKLNTIFNRIFLFPLFRPFKRSEKERGRNLLPHSVEALRKPGPNAKENAPNEGRTQLFPGSDN